MTDSARRNLVGMVVPALALIAVGAALGFTAGSLPDPLATHWGLDGRPNDSMGRDAFVALIGSLVVVPGVVAFLVSRRVEVARGELVPPVAIVTFMQWLFVGVMIATLWANADAASWEQARELNIGLALLIPLGAFVVATGAGAVVAPVGAARVVNAGELPSVRRRRSERLVWSNHVQARWPLLLAAPIALVGLWAMLGWSTVAGVLLVLSAALVGLFALVRVTVDRRGLTVVYGPGSWPRTRIGLDNIERADLVDVKPMSHGGWGYRGSMRIFGRASVVIRSGEALSVKLRNGKRFTVTVDDAETGAGTLNDLVSA